MPDFGVNGKLGIQKLVLEKVFDTNKSLAWTIRLKIDRGHNGPCPTVNVIPEPDRNRVKRGFLTSLEYKNGTQPKCGHQVTVLFFLKKDYWYEYIFCEEYRNIYTTDHANVIQ